MKEVFAHSKEGTFPYAWQSLDSHGESVAKLAAGFASSCNSSDCGSILGHLHDLGKTRTAFQSYLLRCNGFLGGSVGEHTHSGAGACWLWDKGGDLGRALSYCIAGHHAGLPDWTGGENPNGALAVRLKNEKPTLSETPVLNWLAVHEEAWLSKMPQMPPFAFSDKDSSLSFWVRMMFSCLTDADFLDTEKFMSPHRAAIRKKKSSLSGLTRRFFKRLNEKQNNAPDTYINRIRAEIRVSCENAAKSDVGMFSLTVPTGGGKTLSATAFAMKHARRNKLKRIIYVIPYTSITEQTAATLRDFLGTENVIEHHSNVVPESDCLRNRLASENWDAPIVVTTAVQFFESLYGCRPGKCRKLHNIAESVVILDEVQLLPTRLMFPCAEALRQLSLHYRTSVVLSTATQFSLPWMEGLPVKELASGCKDLYGRMKRVHIDLPKNLKARCTWDEIAAELESHRQVLCIVNERRDARELIEKMPKGTYLLSGCMCGEHRLKTITEIKGKLASGEPIQVVATTVVEAGVDIDFPIVYRAFAGLASIIQAAGRCNREGHLRQGLLKVFMPPTPPHSEDLRSCEYAMEEFLEFYKTIPDTESEICNEYFIQVFRRARDLGQQFRELLGVPIANWFRRGTIQSPSRNKYQFRAAANAFKMIDDSWQTPVIARYGNGGELIDQVCKEGISKELARKLQRYAVSVPTNRIPELVDAGLIEELQNPQNPDEPSGMFLQAKAEAYSGRFGLEIFS